MEGAPVRLWYLLLVFWAPTVSVLADSSPFAKSVDDELAKILSGGEPKTVEHLRAMEAHFQDLSQRVIPTTVGVRIGGSQGSGVIVSKNGLVLTAAHVIGRGDKGRRVSLVLHDGRRVEGETLGADHESDSALIQITSENDWPFVEVGKSGDLENGQWCLATGHPGGYEVGRSPPVRIGRVLRNRRGFVTTDCVLVGGDSGGPLFDMNGRVIGIHSRITRSTAGNLHVQIDRFNEDWKRLKAGEVWPAPPAFLGVFLDDRAADARIDEVQSNTPASRGGIAKGDIVLSFGGKAVANNRELRAIIREHKIGQKVKIKVKRGDETVELEVELGKQERR